MAYRGTRYHGWQVQSTPPTWKGETPQDGIPTIQKAVQTALAAVVGHPVSVSGSSRTDAGVHARGQVAHFDTVSRQIPPDGLRAAANARLPDDILIHHIFAVAQSFDAVSSTLRKRYEYLIWNHADRPVFAADLAWHRWQALNLSAMKSAGELLIGTHDFASFAKPGHGREHTIRTVTACDVRREGDQVIIGVEGTGFLWQMVRIIVGTLTEIGMGRYSAAKITEMLVAKDRRAAGPTAPPHGLYLDEIWMRDDT